jgi:hypothetical protein
LKAFSARSGERTARPLKDKADFKAGSLATKLQHGRPGKTVVFG